MLGADLARALDPVRLMRDAGLDPDRWQAELLSEWPSRALLLTGRQTGKSTILSGAVLHKAMFSPGSTILILSPSQRQSAELLTRTRALMAALPVPPQTRGEGELSVRLANGSRLFALPGTEASIRSFTASMIVIDEAGDVDEGLVEAVTPMLATTGGSLWAAGTPKGTRGWFFHTWHGSGAWARWRVPASECPRIAASFLDDERLSLPHQIFAQEYECSWEDSSGAVFRASDLDVMVVDDGPTWEV